MARADKNDATQICHRCGDYATIVQSRYLADLTLAVRVAPQSSVPGSMSVLRTNKKSRQKSFGNDIRSPPPVA